MKRKIFAIVCALIALSMLLTSCAALFGGKCEEHVDNDSDGYCDECKEYIDDEDDSGDSSFPSADLDSIPEYDGSTSFVIINNDVPFFEESEITTASYEKFSELDNLGRCGVAMACIGRDLMPTEDREEIGHVLPSGWHSVQYDVVPGKNLYNRCHLIGFQLTGENDNEKNLITGTRDMNNEAMLPFENAACVFFSFSADFR